MEHDELARIVPPPDWMVQILKEKARPLSPITPGLEDSLQSLVGKTKITRRDKDLGILSRISNLAAHQSFDPPIAEAIKSTQSITLAPGGETRSVLGHEFGHIADFRNTFPGGEAEVKRQTLNPIKGREDFADQFQAAFSSLQRNREGTIDELMERNSLNPASRPLIVELLNSDLFSEHPLRAEAQEALEEPPTELGLPQDATRVALQNLGSLNEVDETDLPFERRSHHTQGQGRVPPGG